MSASAETAVLRIVCPHCQAINRVPVARAAQAAHCGACHATLFAGQPIDVDEAALEKHLRGNDIPVLLDVWAPWCGPCRGMAPHFARAATMLEPQVRLLKLNADTAPQTMARLQIQGIPAMFLFRSGEVLARTAGARDANAIVSWVRQYLPAARGRAA